MAEYGNDDFLFVKSYSDYETRKRTKGFPPKEYDEPIIEDDKLKEMEAYRIERQLKETNEILTNKSLKDEDEIFYVVYTKQHPADSRIKGLVESLKANIVAYLDRKTNGLLLAGSQSKLQ
ncbi:MAG: hypothetical protein LVO36_03380 [Nitrosopumilus sp. (ex Thoosa mismalolli)]|nr:hypothetical protein [Nitrosopumilus sp. (ex Thoosa mismalolli)]